MATYFSKKFIIPILAISVIYFVLTIYLMNFGLVRDTVIGSYPLIYKIRLLFALLEGMWTAMSGTGLIVLTFTAILTAANITLLVDSLNILKKSPKLHLVVGGNTILGIVGSGCAACGLPILSLLGLTGSVMFLPYHGAELSYIAVILLGVSLILLIRSRNQACEVRIQ